MRLIILIFLNSFLAINTYSQKLSQFAKKHKQAMALYENGSEDDVNSALDIWYRLEEEIINKKKHTNELISIYEIMAKAQNDLNNTKLSILYYGKKINLEDSTATNNIAKLISNDSINERLSDRGFEFQKDFILDVRNIIRNKTGSNGLANKIETSDQAYETLEILAYLDNKVKMTLQSNKNELEVYYRRWINRSNEKAWTPVSTDTTFIISRARYQIKYVNNNEEIIKDLPCANGCLHKIKIN